MTTLDVEQAAAHNVPALANNHDAIPQHQSDKLVFVQRLRIFLIGLVIAHHAGQAYGPTGGTWPFREAQSADWLGPFFAINAAFFMGLFFLLSGCFVVGSYERKGFATYVTDRFVRLGIPLLVYAMLALPLVRYFMFAEPRSLVDSFIQRFATGDIRPGHLWFVSLLLVLSLAYAIVARLAGRSGANWKLPAPSDGQVLAYVLALGLAGALVRYVYPQDAWVAIPLLSVEPAHLPQYLSLFVIGLVAGPSRWLSTIPTALCIRWFLLGLAAFVAMLLAYVLQLPLPAWFGRQQVIGIAEAFICVGMILGCLAVFRALGNKPGRWLDQLDANVYGVYLVHWLTVVALQGALLGLDWPVTAKFFVVTALGLALSFALSATLRSIPGVKRVV